MACNSQDVAKSLLDGAPVAFRSIKGWADKAIAQLPDDKLRIALDANTNSIAVIMKHVAGNLLSRWTDFLTTDGEKPGRNRDDEFVDTFASRNELIDRWESGWQRLFDALAALTPDDAGKTVLIRASRILCRWRSNGPWPTAATTSDRSCSSPVSSPATSSTVSPFLAANRQPSISEYGQGATTTRSSRNSCGFEGCRPPRPDGRHAIVGHHSRRWFGWPPLATVD